MRRFTAILLALIYLATTSGIVISTHYCMGEVAGMAIGSSDADTCGTCGMDNEGCCHDDVQVVKLTDNHQTVFAGVTIPSAEALAQDWNMPDPLDQPVLKNYPKPDAHSPPLTHSRNILYCVFRI